MIKLFLLDEIGYNSPKHKKWRDKEIYDFLRQHEIMPDLSPSKFEHRDQDGMRVHKIEIDINIPLPTPEKQKIKTWNEIIRTKVLTSEFATSMIKVSEKNGDRISGADTMLDKEPLNSIKKEAGDISFWLMLAALDHAADTRNRIEKRLEAKDIVVHYPSGANGLPSSTFGCVIDPRHFSKVMKNLSMRLIMDKGIKALSSRFDENTKLLHVYIEDKSMYEIMDGRLVRLASEKQK